MTFPTFPSECFVLLISPSSPYSELQSSTWTGTSDCWAGQRSGMRKKKIKLAWYPVLNQNSSIGSFFPKGSGMRAKTELPFICGKLGFRSGHSLVVYNKLWNHIPLFYLPDSSHWGILSFWRRSLRSGCTVERQFSNVGIPRAQMLGISYRYRVKVMA